MVKRDENRNEIDKINKVEKMSEVQKYMLNILKELVSIFDEHDIKYYMIGGTLLGAIRHKGYIPWDDDIDLAIPRDDYDRFLEIANDILPNSLTLRTYDDESYHHYYFARIVDTRYKILRMGSVKEREEELWIDLFPLDGLPRNTVKRVIHKTRLLTLKVLYHFATFDKVNLMRPNRPFYQRVIIKGCLIKGGRQSAIQMILACFVMYLMLYLESRKVKKIPIKKLIKYILIGMGGLASFQVLGSILGRTVQADFNQYLAVYFAGGIRNLNEYLKGFSTKADVFGKMSFIYLNNYIGKRL